MDGNEEKHIPISDSLCQKIQKKGEEAHGL